jgi:DNA-binding IscR family transcriptional regulator
VMKEVRDATARILDNTTLADVVIATANKTKNKVKVTNGQR